MGRSAADRTGTRGAFSLHLHCCQCGLNQSAGRVAVASWQPQMLIGGPHSVQTGDNGNTRPRSASIKPHWNIELKVKTFKDLRNQLWPLSQSSKNQCSKFSIISKLVTYAVTGAHLTTKIKNSWTHRHNIFIEYKIRIQLTTGIISSH